MYAQLGNFRFEGLRGWDSFSRRTEASYAEHPLIEGKPRLQKTGNALDTIRFDLQLHSSFSRVENDIEGLRAACANGDVLPLIDGKGVLFGNFVIVTIDELPGQTFKDGSVMLARLAVELKEYVLPEQNVEAGFAATAARVFATVAYQSEFAAITLASRQATSSATVVDMHVKDVKKGKGGSAAKAERALKATRDALQRAQRLLQSAKNAIQAKDRIINDIERTKQAVENTTEALQEGNVDGALEANQQLQNGVSAMNGGMSEVAVFTAIRR